MPKLHFLIADRIKEQEGLSALTNPPLLSKLPRSYKRVGHVALVNLDTTLLPWKHEVGEALLAVVSRSIRTVARFIQPIHGQIRTPSVEWLAGDPSFATVHKEHGTLYALDAQKLMFSAGNHFERHRVSEFVSQLPMSIPVVLDMFACVGNLSLAMAVQNPRTQVIALELNPEAINLLRKSVELNGIGISRFRVVGGDNRLTCPSNVADLVILGYFGVDEQQLRLAVHALRSEVGGWLMLHDISGLDEKSPAMQCLENTVLAANPDWMLVQVKRRKIKSIGASFVHWVFDCEVRPQSR